MDAMLLMLLLSSYRDKLERGQNDELFTDLSEAIQWLEGVINKPGAAPILPGSLPGFTPERRF